MEFIYCFCSFISIFIFLILLFSVSPLSFLTFSALSSLFCRRSYLFYRRSRIYRTTSIFQWRRSTSEKLLKRVLDLGFLHLTRTIWIWDDAMSTHKLQQHTNTFSCNPSQWTWVLWGWPSRRRERLLRVTETKDGCLLRRMVRTVVWELP